MIRALEKEPLRKMSQERDRPPVLKIPPPDSKNADRLRQACARRYGKSPQDVAIVHAPYRLCPLGAHIDHQLGPVSAFATLHGVMLAYVVNVKPDIVINSLGYDGEIHIEADERQKRQHDWADYARGAVNILGGEAPLRHGASLLIEGHLSEAGLSSSAAVGLGYLYVLARANGLHPGPEDLIELDRGIENEFMRLNNGILDPAAIALARQEELTIIHCRDRRSEAIPQSADFTFVAIYSGLHEALVDSGKFNNRVAECFEAGGELQRLAGVKDAGPQPLGNTNELAWSQVESGLGEVHRRRARHFFTESARVLAGAEAWRAGDAAEFGRLMQASCLSSINDYETGCPELIRLFEHMCETSGIQGARFCGAGFRGCCIGLVENGRVDDVLETVLARYLRDYPQYCDHVWAIEAQPSMGLRTL